MASRAARACTQTWPLPARAYWWLQCVNDGSWRLAGAYAEASIGLAACFNATWRYSRQHRHAPPALSRVMKHRKLAACWYSHQLWRLLAHREVAPRRNKLLLVKPSAQAHHDSRRCWVVRENRPWHIAPPSQAGVTYCACRIHRR